VPAVTVLAVQSGKRKHSYRDRQFHENAHYAERIRSDPAFREAMFASAALKHARKAVVESRRLNLSPLHVASVLLYRWICGLGIHPRALTMRMRYGRGGWIRELRRIRGLDQQVDRRGERSERSS
jgi:hypothetical protein